MPEEIETVVVPPAPKDFAPKLKFAITAGTQLFVGVLSIAASATVAIYIAKNFNSDVIINIVPKETTE